MYQSTALKKREVNTTNRANAYLVKEILEATPQKLILKIYDYAITHAQKGDLARTNRALSELINSLSFEGDDVKEISIGLMKLYQFCQDQMRKKNYGVVYNILTELRETWVKSFNKSLI